MKPKIAAMFLNKVAGLKQKSYGNMKIGVQEVELKLRLYPNGNEETDGYALNLCALIDKVNTQIGQLKKPVNRKYEGYMSLWTSGIGRFRIEMVDNLQCLEGSGSPNWYICLADAEDVVEVRQKTDEMVYSEGRMRWEEETG